MAMRLVVARRTGRRGAGLGNEMLAWGKGWIASQVLDARLVGPAWGLNQRQYSRNFRTSRLDFVAEEMLARLTPHRFTESDYRATGLLDFGDALEVWARTRGLERCGSHIVTVEGMWGGYRAIRRARGFLLSQLMHSRDALKNSFAATRRDRNKLFVTVHMRAERDGFATPTEGEDVRGRFNIFVPGAWYLCVCEALRRAFGARVQFHFLTDKRDAVFEEAVRRFNPGQVQQTGLTECSDLLLMTEADLRVCSVSSYSLAACFLSDGPYLWYEPQLTLRDGAYSLWGSEREQQLEDSPTAQAMAYAATLEDAAGFQGMAMRMGDPLPAGMVRMLEQRLAMKDLRTNFLDYGAIPATTVPESV
jgi:hypothetical protein